MRLPVIRLLFIARHLFWRLGLWSPLNGRRYRWPKIEFQPLPEIVDTPPPAPQPAAPQPWIPVPELEPELEAFPVFMPTKSGVAEPGLTDIMPSEQREPFLSGWRLVVISLLIIGISIGSFFV